MQFTDVEKLKQQMEKIYQMNEKSSYLKMKVWEEYVFFSWRWWLLVGLSIFFWFLWIKYRKRASTNRLLFAGFIVMTLSLLLDSTGHYLGLWYYNYELIPFVLMNLEWDLAFLPVVVMLFIQIKSNINPLIKAIILSGIASFIMEPLFRALDFVEYPKWHYIYSFIIYIIIYLIAHFATSRNNFNKLKE